MISIKQVKTKDPAPGSYNVEESFTKTQLPQNTMFIFSKEKTNTYVGMHLL